MSEAPMEYKVLKKKFSMSLQKVLGDELKSLIVYGGVAVNKVYSGVSDIDFMIILDKVEKLENFSETIKKIGNEVLATIENPLFASLLDYEIYTLDQIPSGDNMNGFSMMKVLSLKDGEVLFGENYFSDIEINLQNVKSSSLRMIDHYLTKLISFNFSPKFDPMFEDSEENQYEDDLSEETFLAVDAVLLSTQAYFMVKSLKYISMPDVVLKGETEKIGEVDTSIILDVGYLKQGVEHKVENLFERSVNFCGDIIKEIQGL